MFSENQGQRTRDKDQGHTTMYIQITERCNMRCKHCGFACTAKGLDMSIDVFKQAIKMVSDTGDTACIGGGEPTIHPMFWEMLGYAIVMQQEEGRVWLATNGKKTADALRLANIAKMGIVCCELSQDRYHAKIDSKVVAAFQKSKSKTFGYSTSNPGNSRDFRGVRNTTEIRMPIKAGRSKQGTDDCICEDMFITPDGTIKQCGCIDSPIIGHVNSGYSQDYDFGCHKQRYSSSWGFNSSNPTKD